MCTIGPARRGVWTVDLGWGTVEESPAGGKEILCRAFRKCFRVIPARMGSDFRLASRCRHLSGMACGDVGRSSPCHAGWSRYQAIIWCLSNILPPSVTSLAGVRIAALCAEETLGMPFRSRSRPVKARCPAEATPWCRPWRRASSTGRQNSDPDSLRRIQPAL